MGIPQVAEIVIVLFPEQSKKAYSCPESLSMLWIKRDRACRPATDRKLLKQKTLHRLQKSLTHKSVALNILMQPGCNLAAHCKQRNKDCMSL